MLLSLLLILVHMNSPLSLVTPQTVNCEVHIWQHLRDSFEVWHHHKIYESYLTFRDICCFPVTEH